jgi:tRNA threonylcarbamoyladenosine biosynthesis protein TsaB
MKILALEFSSPQRSVALSMDAAQGNWTEHEAIEAGEGSNKPFEMIKNVLSGAGTEVGQVQVLAVGLGPGSYTGIRSAIAIAQGWQLAREVPLLGLSSFECLAAAAHAEGVRGTVSIVIDAQRGEFYLGRYELDVIRWRELEPLRLASREELLRAQQGSLLVGPEVQNWFPDGRTIFPRAAALAKLALDRTNYVPGEQLEPIYLRASTFVKATPPRVLPSGRD